MEQEENKYNLRQMLDEIKEDESITPHAARTISQEEIRKKVLRKRKGAEK